MAYRKLGMRSSTRQAMFKNIVTSLLKEERIETTETRAKELRKIVDKMITLKGRSPCQTAGSCVSYRRRCGDEVI